MIDRMEADPTVAEREMLVRFCTRYTGDVAIAEDLAQQTLLEAWRREWQLRDPQARKSWLLSIARTTCLMWGRRHSRERSRLLQLSDEWDVDDRLVDGFDLELEIEREDLAELLDRAMALLPAETREVLVRRYVEDLPQAEVAALLGLSEGAVEARIHRGKIALKRLLTTRLSDEAVSCGLIVPSQIGWQETRLWCPGCGKRRLEGWLDPQQGRLDLRCPDCSHPYNFYLHAHMGDGLRDMKTFKPAVSRVLQTIHEMYRVRPMKGAVECPRCAQMIPIRRQRPGDVPEDWRNENIYLLCPRCGEPDDRETWHSLTWSLPEARRFWREHPRMRFLPAREIEVGGVPAVVTGFESLACAARLEVVTARDSVEVIRIDGAPGASAASDDATE